MHQRNGETQTNTSFTALAWCGWYETAVRTIWLLFLWHFHFIFNCTLVIMALMVLFCIYLMALWWRSGDTFYFIMPSIILDLLLLCGSLIGYKITAEWIFETGWITCPGQWVCRRAMRGCFLCLVGGRKSGKALEYSSWNGWMLFNLCM